MKLHCTRIFCVPVPGRCELRKLKNISIFSECLQSMRSSLHFYTLCIFLFNFLIPNFDLNICMHHYVFLFVYTYYSQLIHFPVTFLHLLNSVFPLLQKILTFCMNLTEFFSCFIQLDLVIASKNCDVNLFWYQENEKFNDAVEKLYTTSIATNIIKNSYNVYVCFYICRILLVKFNNKFTAKQTVIYIIYTIFIPLVNTHYMYSTCAVAVRLNSCSSSRRFFWLSSVIFSVFKDSDCK